MEVGKFKMKRIDVGPNPVIPGAQLDVYGFDSTSEQPGSDACVPADKVMRLVDYAQSAISAAVINGGSGYSVGDRLGPVGGTVAFDNFAVFVVDDADPVTGAVLSVSVFCDDGGCYPGEYITLPPGTTSTESNGSGFGCLLGIVWNPTAVPIFGMASVCCEGATQFVLKDQFPPFGLPDVFEFWPGGSTGFGVDACIVPHCPDDKPCPKNRTMTWNGTYWEGTVKFCGVSLDVQFHYVPTPDPGDSKYQLFYTATPDPPGGPPSGASSPFTFQDTTTGTLTCVFPTAISWGFDTSHLGCGFIMAIKGQCFNRRIGRAIDKALGSSGDINSAILAVAHTTPPCPSGGDCVGQCCKDIKSWPATLYATFTGLTPPVTVPIFAGCNGPAVPVPIDSCRCNVNYLSETGGQPHDENNYVCGDPITSDACSTGIMWGDPTSGTQLYGLSVVCNLIKPTTCAGVTGAGFFATLTLCNGGSLSSRTCSPARSIPNQDADCGALDLWFDGIPGGPLNVTF